VSAEGITMDPAKVEAITKWPRPMSVTKYHPGKANVVADALSRKSGMIAGIKVEEEITRDMERLNIELYVRGQYGYWASLRVEPDLIYQIKEAQKEDNEIWTIVENLD
nr:putative reverse transcriptase domain-containing protein [Tanacetum cinerariifolium]GFC95308.1 putative reverse transcriptase domain-containing protein [Tanacetum cinerariifolium]